MSLRDDLSENARIILEGLYECGGEANMTELKQITGLDENRTVLYHTEEHLEPSNFVKYEVVEDGTATGITEFTLTERGRDAVKSLVEGTENPNLVEQVEEIREAVSQMKREVDTFAGRIDHIEEQLENAIVGNEIEESVEEATDHFEERLMKVEARQDALLGVLMLYDIVSADHIEEVAEEVSDNPSGSFSQTEWTGAYVGSRAFQDGAIGSAAGKTLKEIDGHPLLDIPEKGLVEFIPGLEESDESEENNGSEESDTEQR